MSWSIDGNGDGVADLAHWADSGFVTEFEGEVFAQIADIQRQSPQRGQAVFDAVWVDRATGREVRRLPQRAGLAWFAELPSRDCAVQAPLTLAVPNGVRRQ